MDPTISCEEIYGYKDRFPFNSTNIYSIMGIGKRWYVCLTPHLWLEPAIFFICIGSLHLFGYFMALCNEVLRYMMQLSTQVEGYEGYHFFYSPPKMLKYTPAVAQRFFLFKGNFRKYLFSLAHSDVFSAIESLKASLRTS